MVILFEALREKNWQEISSASGVFRIVQHLNAAVVYKGPRTADLRYSILMDVVTHRVGTFDGNLDFAGWAGKR